MRRGFDRLAEQAQQVTRQHPQSGHLFVFRSRRGDRLKALYWDKDGYVLWYKRLEVGTFKLPKLAVEQVSVELRPANWRCCSMASTWAASNASSVIVARTIGERVFC